MNKINKKIIKSIKLHTAKEKIIPIAKYSFEKKYPFISNEIIKPIKPVNPKEF